jgi:class 3 adenylate cyclase
MSQTGNVTVMFADISESTKLYETVGDKKALDLIGKCMSVMLKAVGANGGQVVKTIGDEIMAVFKTPDAAVFAASQMNFGLDAITEKDGPKLALRIGLQHGPVILQGNDLFGDTVNMAARLVKLAAKEQIITSMETADLLTPALSAYKRPLHTAHMKGKEAEVELCELIWRQDTQNQTISVGTRTSIRIKAVVLRLKYGNVEIARKRDGEVVGIGRDPSNVIVVESSRASRNHCVIERRGDKYFLIDQSTNGTFVCPEGGEEVELRREEFGLGSHGWISIGQPREEAESVIEYWVE